MQLSAIKIIFHQELQHIYPKTEIDAFFYRLIEHYLGLERFILVLQPDLTITTSEKQPLFHALAQLKEEKPLQYILGVAHFMNLALKVNRQVLIPRPETEELVQWVLDDIRAQNTANNNLVSEPIRLLDIGTGSGCIAITLAKRLSNAKVYALDISEKALEVARENAVQHKVEITWLQGDMLNFTFDPELKFDLIIANPPYVREQEKAEMKNNVKQYEPSTALFVTDEEPLIYYEAVAKLAQQYLTQGGTLYFEINQYLAKETELLLKAYNFSRVTCRQDIFGNDRMLKAS